MRNSAKLDSCTWLSSNVSNKRNAIVHVVWYNGQL